MICHDKSERYGEGNFLRAAKPSTSFEHYNVVSPNIYCRLGSNVVCNRSTRQTRTKQAGALLQYNLNHQFHTVARVRTSAQLANVCIAAGHRYNILNRWRNDDRRSWETSEALVVDSARADGLQCVETPSLIDPEGRHTPGRCPNHGSPDLLANLDETGPITIPPVVVCNPCRLLSREQRVAQRSRTFCSATSKPDRSRPRICAATGM